jgi:hypothetical protein
MNVENIIAQGNELRAQNRPQEALACYATAFSIDFNSANAWNNYGNVIREMGYPERSLPFLQTALAINPDHTTAQFNLAVSYLLMGDYARGWGQYEARWAFEHLNGTLPNFSSPRWAGEDLSGKTILVMGEQGHGDCIQFVRFVYNLHQLGARVLLQVTDGLIPLLKSSPMLAWCGGYLDTPPEFDYWIPMMSLPGMFNVRVDNIPQIIGYLGAPGDLVQQWNQRLGPKTKMRIGISWSGRRDTWLNQHKAVPLEKLIKLVQQCPDYEWINLQIDATPEEIQILDKAGVKQFPGTVSTFADTAALMMNLDLIVGVDTAVSHLAGALGRPTWIMLNNFAVDWRWLLKRDDSPWYVTAKLFRQPSLGDWDSVVDKITQWLPLFKV